MKIGILITTFLRNDLLQQCLNALSLYWNEDYYFIVVDQNQSSCLDSIILPTNIKGEFIKTEFDIGALKARNIAIKRFHELNIPFILMSADSIIFKDKYDFTVIQEFLNKESDRFLCGFNIKHRIAWECDMQKKDCFHLDIPRRKIVEYKNIKFQPVDLCRNFFLAKTNLLINSLYDEDRKMADHETSFWRWKEKEYKCYYTDNIEANYVLNRPNEYNKMRNRFGEIRRIMMQKYNLSEWVKYSSELIEHWNEWRKNEKL